VSDAPVILDPAAVLPLRVTMYGHASGYWLDEPGIPHRDHRYID